MCILESNKSNYELYKSATLLRLIKNYAFAWHLSDTSLPIGKVTCKQILLCWVVII